MVKPGEKGQAMQETRFWLASHLHILGYGVSSSIAGLGFPFTGDK